MKTLIKKYIPAAPNQKDNNMKMNINTIEIKSYILWIQALALIFTATPAVAELSNAELASRLFNRLAGRPLLLNDPRRAVMEAAIANNDMLAAARVATDEADFINVTVRGWAAPLSSRSSDPQEPLNDFIATVMGAVRDDFDFRRILWDDIQYVANPDSISRDKTPAVNSNRHYETLDREIQNVSGALTLISQQDAKPADQTSPEHARGNGDIAGVLTTRAWGMAHLSAGTNRRATEYTIKQFMCRPLADMMDTSMPTTHIRRDVDRQPGGNVTTFLSNCRGCHGGLDALSTAWSHFDYNGNRIRYRGDRVQSKVRDGSNPANNQTYAAGHIPPNDNWRNNFVSNRNADLGWRGATNGRGVSQFGQMVANSEAFSKCMAKRVFKKVCQRDFLTTEDKDIEELANRFENDDNYNMKRLFERVATLPQCLEN